MITVYNAMLVTLGTLLAALLVLLVMPAYRRRIERFTTERMKRALPLTEAEIRADKDRIRAEFATEVHKLEMKLEEASLSAARQSVEINRRDARIHEAELALAAQKSNVEEHLNARRVLEQTILDRLPKVENRLAEARRMLLQRDTEIATLAETSSRQTEALEQATQINVQLTEEVNRLRAALETRAARNREAIGDPRFDGEVALRSEIEALRAKTRDQAQMIERLQAGEGAGEASDNSDAARGEIERLKRELARAESEALSLKAGSANEEALKVLATENHEQASEIARLKASLSAYEQGTQGEAADALSAKAELSALQTEAAEQRRTIEALRAEVAGSNERLARQAQHFRDEMRRLAAQQGGGEVSEGREGQDAPRRSLADRIAQPRVPRQDTGFELSVAASADVARDARPPAVLKAVNGGADHSAAAEVAVQPSAAQGEAAAPARRARLLERISNIDKSG